jgi:proton-dependent oligopeptide transporter, POT family
VKKLEQFTNNVQTSGVATFGHILIVVSALPSVIATHSVALAPFVIGLIFFGIGVGFFKVNISPLIAEQYEAQQPRAVIKTLKSGERVIVDPVTTISSIYIRFYFFINVGSLVGQIAMPYAEKYVGFWLAFTLPTILFLICPFVMLFCRNRYVRRPPTGSVLSKTLRLLGLAMKGRWSANPVQTVRNMRANDFWENVKPSRLGEQKPDWMTFDDAWVDEVRRGLKACAVFAWYPIYWLSYNQLNNNLISQAASMRLDSVPNEVASILDPLALLIFIPIFDKIIYPAIARTGYKLTPIKRITAGFYLGTAAMVVAAIIQHYIYVYSPCGAYASDCKTPPEQMSVWIQTPAYVLLAFSEIGASVTGLEYAFTKAPKNMRGLVTGVFWFAQAFSAALSQAFVGLAADPLLVWLYTAVAIISLLGGIGFWLSFYRLDAEEEALNTLPDSVFQGARNADADVEATLAAKEEQEKIRHAQGLDEVTEKVRHG